MKTRHSTNTLNTFITAVGICSLLSAPAAFAGGKRAPSIVKAEAQGAAVATTASIVGAVAGGPIGFIIGATTGIFLGEQGIRSAETKVALSEELSETKHTVASLENDMKSREQKIAKLEKSAANRLEFMVLFPTGEDELRRQDVQRLSSLANYMKDNPDLRIRLDGHADPRGTDEYNNVLSRERALSVVKALTERGIDPTRIDYFFHGSALSSAYQGDMEAYALERKVKIEVYSEAASQNVAVN